MPRYSIRALAVAAALVVAPLAFLADSAGLSAQEPAGRENAKGSKKKDLPLEPGRKLAFTALEGTWMSLDGADTVALTTEKTGDFLSPEWAPDGQYVVASKGRRNLKLWLYHVDGGSGTELHDGGTSRRIWPGRPSAPTDSTCGTHPGTVVTNTTPCSRSTNSPFTTARQALRPLRP